MEGTLSPATSPPPLFLSSLLPSLAVMDRLDGGLQHHHERDGDEREERDGGMDSGMYLGPGSSQEGLSPCHLKKAKLMFFYARYPSSNTLKTYFPDVKFNRCVTSSSSSWFSNFVISSTSDGALRQAGCRDGAPCLGEIAERPPTPGPGH
nr:homeobox protein prospero homolog 1-like [Salvelinus alpinus]